MPRFAWLVLTLGATLIAGGTGHLFGVARLYASNGLPDMDRMLIDLWVGQVQIVAGAFYLVAFRASRRGRPWQSWALAAAVTVIGWTGLVIPVLFARAPITFRLPALAYLILSIWVVVTALRSITRESRRANAAVPRNTRTPAP